MGWSEGGPIAIAYAAAHPERVSHLVLYGTYARLLQAPGYSLGRDPARAAAILALVEADWGTGSRLLASGFIPEFDSARVPWYTAYTRAACSPRAAAQSLASVYEELDVREFLPSIRQPALVLHRRDDFLTPFPLGRYLAEHLPNATFLELKGEHHLPYFGDAQAITDAIDSFLGPQNQQPSETFALDALSPREREVLRLVAEGLPNRDIAARLGVSPTTVARHLANIYAKLGVNTRSAAAAYAFKSGLV
jgi:DNA-binding CsgD family transcriptional regulator/pimeloyl-ACP methyl ester carboxylesterase